MCGQRCKEIIDSGNALTQSVQCMNASILLTAHSSPGPDKMLAEEYRRSADQTAMLAQKIAAGLNKHLTE
jgi:hypothetical protein